MLFRVVRVKITCSWMLNILKQLKDFLFSNFILLRVAWQSRIVARFNIVERESVKLFGHFHYWHFKQSFSSLPTSANVAGQVWNFIWLPALLISKGKVNIRAINLTSAGKWGTPTSSNSPHSSPSLSSSSVGKWWRPPLSCPDLLSAAPVLPPAPSSGPYSEVQ